MTSAEMNKAVRQLRKLRTKQSELEAEIEILESALKNEMTTTGIYEFTGKDYKLSWNQVCSNRLDSKSLKAALPDVYRQFTVQSVTRRFVLA